jgi:hypothetical protein
MPSMKVEKTLLDESIRLGSLSATHATLYLRVSRVAVDAIEQAIELMSTGRTGAAHDRLRRAKLAIDQMTQT